MATLVTTANCGINTQWRKMKSKKNIFLFIFFGMIMKMGLQYKCFCPSLPSSELNNAWHSLHNVLVANGDRSAIKNGLNLKSHKVRRVCTSASGILSFVKVTNKQTIYHFWLPCHSTKNFSEAGMQHQKGLPMAMGYFHRLQFLV